jgi:uncharacterized membrane protein
MTDATAQRVNPAQDHPSGAFCYGFGALVPLIYLSTHPRHQQDPFLGFHCLQCLILFSLFALYIPLKFDSDDILTATLLLLFLGLLFAMLQAGRGKRFHLPLIGWLAERLV